MAEKDKETNGQPGRQVRKRKIAVTEGEEVARWRYRKKERRQE